MRTVTYKPRQADQTLSLSPVVTEPQNPDLQDLTRLSRVQALRQSAQWWSQK